MPLTDRKAIVESLTTRGFDSACAEAKAKLFAASIKALTAAGGAKAQRAYYVPGRIEVLGKHTDYAGGSSVVATAERGFCLVASARDDSQIVVTAAARDETIRFVLDSELVPSQGDWSNYPMTVARRMARNFPGIARGANIAFSSDLPPAAGMSSSSALMIAVFFALGDANDVWHHPSFPNELDEPLNLAGYLATIENGQSYGNLEGDRGVGTFGGSEDHTAILCARAGHLSQYAYCPVRFEKTIPMPDGYTFAIATSGVAAEKTGEACAKYNRASQLAATVTELWQRETGRGDAHLATALRSSQRATDSLREIVSRVASREFDSRALLNRLEHFIVENEQVIPAAGDALLNGDLDEFGRWVDRSQRAAEELLGNQIPETAYLAATAREHGAVAASAFGAGFGGSVWAMVKQTNIDTFLAAWHDAYRTEFTLKSENATFFATTAGPAMFRL